MLRRKIAAELRLIEREEKWRSETTELLPFADTILALNDARMRMESLDPEKAAATLDKLAAQIDLTRRGVEAWPARCHRVPRRPRRRTRGSARRGGARAAPTAEVVRTMAARRRSIAAVHAIVTESPTTSHPAVSHDGPATPIKATKLVAFRAQDPSPTLDDRPPRLVRLLPGLRPAVHLVGRGALQEAPRRRSTPTQAPAREASSASARAKTNTSSARRSAATRSSPISTPR